MGWQEFRRILRESRKDGLGMGIVEFARHISTRELIINKSTISRLENAGAPNGTRDLTDYSVRQTLALIAPHTRKHDGTSYSVEELIAIAYDKPMPSQPEEVDDEEEDVPRTIERLGRQIYQLISNKFAQADPIDLVQALSVAQLVALKQTRSGTDSEFSPSQYIERRHTKGVTATAMNELVARMRVRICEIGRSEFCNISKLTEAELTAILGGRPPRPSQFEGIATALNLQPPTGDTAAELWNSRRENEIPFHESHVEGNHQHRIDVR